MPVSSSTRVDHGPSHGVRMRRERVPMRDGVSLNASVYTPRSDGRVPAVMELTPYTVDSAHGEGQYFPTQGLAYVVADVRGRGDSEGDFRQSFNDAVDAVDLIDWIIQQPWSDGRVVLYGGSYTGLNQWLILGMRHPALAAASPAAAPVIGMEIPRGSIPNAYDFKWRAMVLGKPLYTMSGVDGGLWAQEIRAAMEEGRPIWTAAEAFGVPYDDDLRRFIERPGLEHWTDLLPTDAQLTGLDVPVFTVTGTHDDCMPGTIHHWQRFVQLARTDRLFRDLAKRNNGILVAIAIDGQLGASRDFASALGSQQDEVETVGNLVDAIFNGNACHEGLSCKWVCRGGRQIGAGRSRVKKLRSACCFA